MRVLRGKSKAEKRRSLADGLRQPTTVSSAPGGRPPWTGKPPAHLAICERILMLADTPHRCTALHLAWTRLRIRVLFALLERWFPR